MDIRLLIACATEGASSALAKALSGDRNGEARIVCTIVAVDRACSVAAAVKPHVALLEQPRGLALVPEIRRASSATRSLLLDERYTREQVLDVVRCGGAGCVLRSSPAALMAKAVRVVHHGGTWFARADLLGALCAQLRVLEPYTVEGVKLTTREQEILRLTGRGLSNKEIGRTLAISDLTVKTHLHHVYAKLHQSGRIKVFVPRT